LCPLLAQPRGVKLAGKKQAAPVARKSVGFSSAMEVGCDQWDNDDQWARLARPERAQAVRA